MRQWILPGERHVLSTHMLSIPACSGAVSHLQDAYMYIDNTAAQAPDDAISNVHLESFNRQMNCRIERA